MQAQAGWLATVPWLAILGWLWLVAGVYLALDVMLQKRAPAATLAWILALCLIPPVGLLVYRFVGPRRIKRQSLRRTRSQLMLKAPQDACELRPGASCHTPPVWIRQHAMLIEHACGLPVSSCTGVQLLGSGSATLQAILEAVQQARQHVHLEYYIFEPDTTGQELLQALCEKARQGVRVRLLVDAVGSARLLRRAGRALLAPLLEAGGELAVFHPARMDRWRPLVNLRTHRKIVVCDAHTGFTGGINITDDENDALRPQSAYRDTHLMLQGAAVRWLQFVFMQDWVYASGKADFEDGIFADAPAGSHAVQIVASGPDSERQAIHHSMVHAISAAQERIWLATPYFVPTEPAWFALLNAAQRGVEVRLMVPKRSDSYFVTMAARSYFRALRRAGVQIYEYHGAMLHAKTLLVDAQYSLVGTANFDHRSFVLNFEIAVALYDTALNTQLAAMFSQDMQRCTPVGEYPGAKPLRLRLGEALARLFSPLL